LYDDVIHVTDKRYELDEYLDAMSQYMRWIGTPTAERKAAEGSYETHAVRIGKTHKIAKLFHEAHDSMQVVGQCTPHNHQIPLATMIQFGPELNALAATYYDVYGDRMPTYPSESFDAILRLHGERNLPV
jgi:hypothetical protein